MLYISPPIIKIILKIYIMRKIYSLFAVAFAAMTMNAQVLNATFSDITGTGGNSGGWSGTSVATTAVTSYTTGGVWTLSNAYAGDSCLKMGTGSKLGELTTPALSGLLSGATLTFRAGAWDNNNEKTTLKISISGAGTLSATSVTLVKGAFTTYTISVTDGNDTTKITFSGEQASNSRFFIDDIKIDNVTAAVADFNSLKSSLVKSTVVGNEISFKAKSDVKVYNLEGRLVKSGMVSENKGLNVSDSTAGTYIVTGSVNNKAVSEKVIKK